MTSDYSQAEVPKQFNNKWPVTSVYKIQIILTSCLKWIYPIGWKRLHLFIILLLENSYRKKPGKSSDNSHLQKAVPNIFGEVLVVHMENCSFIFDEMTFILNKIQTKLYCHKHLLKLAPFNSCTDYNFLCSPHCLKVWVWKSFISCLLLYLYANRVSWKRRRDCSLSGPSVHVWGNKVWRA